MENDVTLLIDFQSVSLFYGRSAVLEPFCLQLHQSEYVGITGPSGAGKTSLLRLAAGLQYPTQGRVTRLAGLRFGLVAQQSCLLPWRKTWENIAIPLIDSGKTRQEAKDCAYSILQEMNLEYAAGKWAGALSGGMARRVSIARAVAFDPDVLLLDEPFAGLDAEAREVTLALITRFADRRHPLVLHITHTLSEINSNVTRILDCRDAVVKTTQKERQCNEQYDKRFNLYSRNESSLGCARQEDNAGLLASGQPG
jgi:ABC-type nitrate/sulfonate/bicarbonate transport system ATPase subunit